MSKKKNEGKLTDVENLQLQREIDRIFIEEQQRQIRRLTDEVRDLREQISDNYRDSLEEINKQCSRIANKPTSYDPLKDFADAFMWVSISIAVIAIWFMFLASLT